MTPEIISALTAFAPLFTRPTWKNINTLLIGAILCRGARRITSILRVMGLSEIKNFSKYHRVLSRTQWNSLIASQILFGLLVNLLPESWPIIVAVDETLERRRGKKIKAIISNSGRRKRRVGKGRRARAHQCMAWWARRWHSFAHPTSELCEINFF